MSEPDFGSVSPPDEAFAPPTGAPVAPTGSDDAEALLLGVMRDVRDLLSHLLQRLEQLDRAIGALPGPVAIEPLDAKVVELGGAIGSIVTMLENLESSVQALAASPGGIGAGPGPSAALVERVAAAGGPAATNALLHARIESIERHAETTAAELGRLKAQLDFIEEGIGYLASGLLGGTTQP